MPRDNDFWTDSMVVGLCFFLLGVLIVLSILVVYLSNKQLPF